MIGIDTNVLVRYLVQDDAKQCHQATRFIEKECTPDAPGFINGIVLCELVWVLETAYDYTRESITTVLEHILRVRQFYIYEAEVLWKSVHGYKHEGADFADNYIAHHNARNGCEYTVTFDKTAARLKHFERL